MRLDVALVDLLGAPGALEHALRSRQRRFDVLAGLPQGASHDIGVIVGLDASVRIGAAQGHRLERAWYLNVGGIGHGAGDLQPAIDAVVFARFRRRFEGSGDHLAVASAGAFSSIWRSSGLYLAELPP